MQDNDIEAGEAAPHVHTSVQLSVAGVLEKLSSELGDEEGSGRSQGWC